MRTLDRDRYKWIALLNATLAVLLATLDGSITIIAMPDIFRGIHLDPLVPANSFYLLWMILGYLVVTSVLIVSLGRLGDMVGRVKIYRLGFVIYTVASLLLALDWMQGRDGAVYLIGFRVVQGIGGACLLANSAAIITDAFPSHQRGVALGINNIVGVSGTFIGLVLGGVLAPIDWRLVFLISVPVGIFGTVWAYRSLRELSSPRAAPIDWWGNVTFALGLILIMTAVTYGIRPADGHAVGWGSPRVLGLLAAGVVSLVTFVNVERHSHDPMFRLPLFRIRAFTYGTLSTFLSSIARGGLMFMLIIWLQGIWLPQHGYSFTQTPLWAGIYMLPLTVGLLCAGPASGYLSDRFGARPFATAGMLLTAVGFVLLLLLPTSFSYVSFGLILLLIGISMGLFASPNRAAVMNSLPRADRGAGGAMNQTFQNSAQVLSIGVFFTLLIMGLASTLPQTMSSGLEAHGVSVAAARRASMLPPVSILFAAFLGYNPVQHLLGAQVLTGLSAHSQSILTGSSFFPNLISAPFRDGLHAAFLFAIVACLIAAAASLMRGGHPAYDDDPPASARPSTAACWRPSPRSNMHVEWYGQSSFRLTDGSTTVFVDPFGDMTPMLDRGMRWDYPAIAGVEADLLLVTHEHLDHNGVEAVGGDPVTLRSTAGRLESPIGKVLGIASEHDEVAGTERGANTLFVFTLAGRRVAHLGDLGQRALRDEQLAALGTVDLLFVPVGGGPTIGAQQATEIGAALGASVIVPMHYNTERIDFLEPVDEFAERAARAQRLSSPAFDLEALPTDDTPLVIVPAAP